MRQMESIFGKAAWLATLCLLAGCTSQPVGGVHLVPEQSDQKTAVQLIDYRMRTAILDRPWKPPFSASIQASAIEKEFEFHSSNRSIRGALFVVGNTSVVVFDGSRGLQDALLSFPWGGIGLREFNGEVLAGYGAEFLRWENEGGIRELIEHIKSAGSAKLIVCGYSVGGDYALLSVYWLRADYGISSTVTTLNSPQMATRGFAAAYESSGIPTINYSYGNDPASQFPPRWLGWMNPGTQVHIGGPRNLLMDWDSHYLEHFYQIVDSTFVFAGPSSINY